MPDLDSTANRRFRSAWTAGTDPSPAATRTPPTPVAARVEATSAPLPLLLVEPARWRVALTGALVAVAVLWVGWQAGRTFLADVGSARARNEVQQWSAHTLAPDAQAMANAQTDLEDALRWTPDNPALHEQLGDLFTAQAQASFTQQQPDAAQRVPALLQQARAAYLQAAALRPAWPIVWSSLATVYYGLGDRPAYLAAWQQALRLGPNEPGVQSALLDLTLLDWAQATPAQQAWAVQLFEKGDAGRRAAINRRARVFGLEFADE